MSHQLIHPLEVMKLPPADRCIVDVRTTAEVNTSALPDCIHIPLHDLTPERLKNEISKTGKSATHVFLLCQSGRRAVQAADQLKGQINAQLVIIEGGMNSIKQAQIPLICAGRKVLPLDRQMRIAAGLLILLGAVLGAALNPGFYTLCAFVGGGLVFAGITDLCPLTRVIAKMPWNR